MVPKLIPETHQLWLPSNQILVHLKQLFVVLQLKKIWPNLEGYPINPHILSYKEAIFAIHYQML